MNYELPQVRVFQDLEASVEPSTRAMLPVIIGQRKDLIRYAEDDEKDLGDLGLYDALEMTVGWPNLDANSVVLQDTVRVFAEDALVAIQKDTHLDDIVTVCPLNVAFNEDDYFTPVLDGQENIFVFESVENNGVNLNGADLYRTPAPGDRILIRQTSQDTEDQDEDWSAQVVGVIETETVRSQGGVGNPVEAASNVLTETGDIGTTIDVSNEVAGDETLQLTYKIVALTDIAETAGPHASVDHFVELATDKACEYGLFNLADLGFAIRVSNVTDEEMDLTISSLFYNETITVAHDQFVKYDDKVADRVWFAEDGTWDVNSAALGGALGGITVDDMFIIFAEPETTVTVGATGLSRAADSLVTVTATDHGLATGDRIVIDGSTAATSDFDGRYDIIVTGASEFTFVQTGVTDVELSTASGTITSGSPIKNDAFELQGTLNRPSQIYSDDIDDVPEITVANFDSTTSTVYTIEVISGGTKDTVNGDESFTPDIRLKISSNNYLDPVVVQSIALDVGNDIPLNLGTKGIEIKFNDTSDIIALAKGDMWTIDCTGRSGDALVGVITDKNFPYYDSAFEGMRLDIEFLDTVESVNIPKVRLDTVENWEITEDDNGVTINAGVKVITGSVSEERYVSSANMFIQYEAINNSDTGAILTITSSADDRLGLDDPANPLGYGVRKALLNAQGVPVIAVPLDEMESIDFDDAFASLSNNNNAYQLVPLTYSEELQNKTIAHCLSMSTELMDLWRVAYICTDIGSEYPLADVDGEGSEITATFIDSGSGVYNLVKLDPTVVDVSFTDLNIKAGNTLRYLYGEDMYGTEIYSELAVLSVLTDDELLVLGDFGGPSSSLKIEVHHDTTADDVVETVGSRSEGLATRRVTNVYPSVITDDAGRTVPGYFGAAALAGLAAGVDPHQGLTNSKILGFTEASSLTPMSRMDIFKLNELAGTGVTILIGENSDIGVRHEVTTATIDRKNRETMVTRNLDSLSYQYFDGLSPFIGIANVTPEFIEKVRTELKSLGGYIIASTRRPLIGSQMISCEIDTVEQDAVLSDKINIYLSPVLPYPFNYGDIHLQI